MPSTPPPSYTAGPVFLYIPLSYTSGAFHTPAFLHITANVDKEFDSEVDSLWLLGSANDFEGAPGGHGGEVEGDAPIQPDEIYVAYLDETTDEGAFIWRRRYRAPTQSGWLHRMMLYPTRNGAEILFATQLKADQVLAVVPATAYTGRNAHSAPEFCDALTKPALGCSAEDWVGKMRDVFSPDDTCPESTRYVSLVGGKLHVSASHTDDGCTSTWGIKYDPTTTVDPIITLDEADACTGKVSFRSKVGPDAPIYADAQVPPRPTPADAPRRRLPTPNAAACQRPTPLPRVPYAPTHSHDATDCIRTLPATERVHACVARRGARSTSR